MNKILLSILLPIIALAGWALMLEYHWIAGTEVRLKVQGYDPRDLLSGHYMRFSLDLGGLQPCVDNLRTGPVCLCLAPSTDGIYDQPVSDTNCSEIERYKTCLVYLRGECDSIRFVTGLERFSIPEEWAPVLLTLPPNSSISVSLDSNGNGQATGMYVESEPLDKYAARKLAEQKVTELAPAH